MNSWASRATRTIIPAFVATRAGLLLIGVLALWTVPIDLSREVANCVHEPRAPAVLEIWSRWDAPWYLAIVEHGYGGDLHAHCDMRSTRFPLYPGLVWTARLALRQSLVAGLVVSNVALMLFLFALWRLVEMDFGPQVSARAVWIYLLFPSSLFLSGIYAESLMLACTVSALLAARQSHWPGAGMLIAGALLSHPVGVLVAVPVAIDYLIARDWRFRAIPPADVAWLLLPSVVASTGYFVWSARVFGNPLAFVAAQQDYRGAIGWPWKAFVVFWENGPRWHGYDNSILDASLAVAAVGSLPFLFRRFRLSYALYATVSVLVPLSSSLVSFSRIVLGAFPCFVLLAIGTDRKTTFLSLLAASGGLLAVLTAMFATWRWVA